MRAVCELPGKPTSSAVSPDPYDRLWADGSFGGTVSDCQTWSKLPSAQHSRGANLSFADGHAEFDHWLAPKIFHDYNWPPTPGGDLHDLRYLQSVIPHLR
jgi:prepilin-type processing-associated H-X9-DG protein